jgi:hypothetical protein
MRKRKNPKAPPYVVGYGRPPKATQFAKGESGNPRGRPKGTRTVGAMLQEILRQKIAVTENGRTRRLPALEVILRRLTNDAMRSEPRALKLLLALNDRYGESAQSDLHLDEILAEDKAILASFLNQPPRASATKDKPGKRSASNGI